ncbi:MAG: hypothetical protein WC655_05910 [Candidatus Hydrogenedentales bacterium]|jgi:hypothetical protein
MNRESIRWELSALAFGLVAVCLAHAQDSPVTYDIRVFQVSKPITKFPVDTPGSRGGLCGLVQLQEGGWTAESGLPLNDQGDVLFWDGEKSASSPGITRLASENGVGNRKTITIDSGVPLQYLEPRTDGRYELKTTDKGFGFSLTLACAGADQTRVWIGEGTTLKRFPVPGVHLDVGKPTPSILTHLIIKTPPEEWFHCIVLDSALKETGNLLIFIRMHGQPVPGEVGPAIDDKEKLEQFSVEWKFFSIPPDVDAKLSGAFRLDPPGGVCVKEICAPGNPQPFASLGEVTDWLNTVEGVELISAPRITTLTLRDHRAHARKEALAKVVMRSGSGMPAQQDSMFDFVKTSPIAASAFERLWQPGFGMIADFATIQTDSADTSKTDWTGISVLLTVDGCETPGTAILDFAAVHRYRAPDTTTPRDRVEPLKRTGPEFERVTRQVPPPPVLESGIVSKTTLNAEEWKAFTTIEPGTGNRLLLFVTADQVDPTGAKFIEVK